MRASSVTKMEVEPFLVSIPQTTQLIGRCTATVYELLGSGQLRAVKSDGRTLVTMDSIKSYVASLPPAVIAPRPRRKPQHLRERTERVRTRETTQTNA
jgi:hypothetical protein